MSSWNVGLPSRYRATLAAAAAGPARSGSPCPDCGSRSASARPRPPAKPGQRDRSAPSCLGRLVPVPLRTSTRTVGMMSASVSTHGRCRDRLRGAARRGTAPMRRRRCRPASAVCTGRVCSGSKSLNCTAEIEQVLGRERIVQGDALLADLDQLVQHERVAHALGDGPLERGLDELLLTADAAEVARSGSDTYRRSARRRSRNSGSGVGQRLVGSSVTQPGLVTLEAAVMVACRPWEVDGHAVDRPTRDSGTRRSSSLT